jgi:hypothetical protein
MPLTQSSDMGNVDGKVHSHRFPGANTALPTANEDAAQLKATEDFLTNGAVTVDIFALSQAGAPVKAAPSKAARKRSNRDYLRRRRRSGNKDRSQLECRSCTRYGAAQPSASLRSSR